MLDSLFPIYYDDLTEEEKQDGVVRFATAIPDESTTYTVTVTPTSDWYAQGDNGWGEKGEPVTVTGWYENGYLSIDTIVSAEPYDGIPTGEFIIGSLILAPAVIESVTVAPSIQGFSSEISKYLPIHVTELKNADIDAEYSPHVEYSITVIPNENAYAFDEGTGELGTKGQPVTYTKMSLESGLIFDVAGALTVGGQSGKLHVNVGSK